MKDSLSAIRLSSLVFLILGCFVFLVKPLSDPDLWLHLVIGRWIRENQTIPLIDHWNLLRDGENFSWSPYSWLAEVLFSKVESFSGLSGLIVLQSINSSLLVILTSFFCYKISRSITISILVAIGILFGMDPIISPLRPQVTAWVLYATVLYLAVRVKSKDPKTQSIYLISLFICFVIWSNIHISTIIGITGAICFSFSKEVKNYDRLKTTALVLLFSVLGTLFTPHLGSEWSVAFSHSSHPLLFNQISEFKPALILSSTTIALIFFLLLNLLSLQETRREAHPLTVLYVFSITLLSLYIRKFTPFGFIANAIFLAQSFELFNLKNFRYPEPFGKTIELIDDLLQKHQKSALLVSICFFISSFSAPLENRAQFPINDPYIPVKATEFLKAEMLPKPVLNYFGQGAYLIYSFSDEKGKTSLKVPIDGRTNVDSHELLTDYFKTAKGVGGWKNYLDKVKPETILWPQSSALVSILIESPDWCRIYKENGGIALDGGNSIFVKREFLLAQPERFNSDDCENKI